ncbi:MAG: very short patch repair endonuclease [Thermoplasmatales archaeon]
MRDEGSLADVFSKEKRSWVMSRIKGRNTFPEVKLRSELWRKGLRFRIHYGPEKIDIAFPSAKIAVFVDGCFWHKCPIHFRMPKSNLDYWYTKLSSNAVRDKERDERLLKNGWKPIHVWEHEIKKDFANASEKIYSSVKNSRKIF